MRPTDLRDRVAGDLDGCRLRPVDATHALLETDAGPLCWWEVRQERRRLLQLQVSAFHLDGPATTADVRVTFRHTGNVRRTGLRASVKGRDQLVGVSLRDQLLADGELQAASLPLDFTRFTVEPLRGRWRATLELMGGSYVRTTFPPSGSYVRLAADQTAALLATVRVLHRRLPVAPETLRPDPSPASDLSDHLPRRTV
ncbi:DUF3156 family protein [Egicoccus sp. AB-alg2]|uniref:DUF3156 family protein n=1 Tax=Egicoccus sp. AB-alg2 TaxID=3242693 RepID=UPI00359EED63